MEKTDSKTHTTKRPYCPPELKVVEFEVEHGFQASGFGLGLGAAMQKDRGLQGINSSGGLSSSHWNESYMSGTQGVNNASGDDFNGRWN